MSGRQAKFLKRSWNLLQTRVITIPAIILAILRIFKLSSLISRFTLKFLKTQQNSSNILWNLFTVTESFLQEDQRNVKNFPSSFEAPSNFKNSICPLDGDGDRN